MSKFYPKRKDRSRSSSTERRNHICWYHLQQEGTSFCKGQVVSVGEPTILPSGKEVTTTQRMVIGFCHQQLAQNISGFDILKHEDIIAIVDEDTDMTQ